MKNGMASDSIEYLKLLDSGWRCIDGIDPRSVLYHRGGNITRMKATISNRHSQYTDQKHPSSPTR